MTVHEMLPTDNMWTLDADIYVVPTNARGIFGAGLAKDFAAMFPTQAATHAEACQRGDVAAGDMHADGLGPNGYGNPSWVAFISTKDDPFQPSQLEWVRRGLAALFVLANMRFVCPRGRIALPAIGCGLGGLRFLDVHKLVLDQFDSAYGLEVALFPPH